MGAGVNHDIVVFVQGNTMLGAVGLTLCEGLHNISRVVESYDEQSIRTNDYF